MAESDVSVSLTQRTLTDASTAQLQVSSPPPGGVQSSLSFPVTTTHSLLGTLKPQPAPLRPVASTSLTTPGIAPLPRQAAPIPIRSILLLNPPAQKERLHPRWLPHYNPHPDCLRSHRICVWSHTNTSTSADVDRCCPPYTESTTVDLETKL